MIENNTPMIDVDAPIRERIKEIRELKKLSRNGLAKKIVPPTIRGTIKKIEEGPMHITYRWMARICTALDCKVMDLLNGIMYLPISYYLGRGHEVMELANTDHMIEITGEVRKKLDGTEDVIEIMEESFGLYTSGDKIIYKETPEPPVHDGLFLKKCVIKLKDGRKFIRFLHPGSEPGKYILNPISINEPPMINVEIEWASRIIAVIMAE